MAGICTFTYSSPYPIEKVRDFPYPYSYLVNGGIFPSKQERIRAIPTGTGLFVISTWDALNSRYGHDIYVNIEIQLNRKNIGHRDTTYIYILVSNF